MANERIISADSHVNPPKDLWITRAPEKLRERAPRVESTPQGDFWIVDSQISGAIGLDASAGRKPEEFKAYGLTYKEMRPGSYDPDARLADMSIDGVDAEVLYFGGPVTSLLTSGCLAERFRAQMVSRLGPPNASTTMSVPVPRLSPTRICT